MSTPPSKPAEGAVVTFPIELVRACCEDAGLDPYRDADEVASAASCPVERECCDSGCDPCVQTIVRAAQLLRQRYSVK